MIYLPSCFIRPIAIWLFKVFIVSILYIVTIVYRSLIFSSLSSMGPLPPMVHSLGIWHAGTTRTYPSFSSFTLSVWVNHNNSLFYRALGIIFLKGESFPFMALFQASEWSSFTQIIPDSVLCEFHVFNLKGLPSGYLT